MESKIEAADFIKSETRMVVARTGIREKRGDIDQREQILCYKKNKF